MKIYLDICCLNWPFDDQTQARIHLEAEAVLLILRRVGLGEWEWVGSPILELEISKTPDAERRERVRMLCENISMQIAIEPSIAARAGQLERWGFGAYDALHLACAEAGVDVFLTTDDRLIRQARRLADKLSVRVENPLKWIYEVMENE